MANEIITQAEPVPGDKFLPERLVVRVGKIEIDIDGISHGTFKIDGNLIKMVTGFTIEAFAGEQPVVVVSLSP